MNALETNVRIDADQNMNLKVGLRRLYLEDTQTVVRDQESGRCEPLLASDFKAKDQKYADESLGQLEVKLDKQARDNVTAIEVLFTDFRVSIAFHTMRAGIRYLRQVLDSSRGLMDRLKEMQQPATQPQVALEKPAAATPTTPPAKGRTQLLVTIYNIEATMRDTTVTKFMIKGNANVINDMKDQGAVTRVVDASVENMSMTFFQPRDVAQPMQSILSEFDIRLRYKEDVGLAREIGLDVKPIKLKVTLKQLLFFRKFADQIAAEADSLDLGSLGSAADKSQPVLKPEIAPQSVEASETTLNVSQALAVKLQLSAKVGLVNLTLEDDLTKWRYPLVRVWAVHISLAATVDPKKEKHFVALMSELAVELGKSLNQEKDKYRGKVLPKPTITFKGDTEVYPPYKELMYFLP